MKILHLISSPRGEASASIKLGRDIAEKLKAAHQGSTITEHNLTQAAYPHLEEVHFQSFFTPAEARTPEQAAAVVNSDAAVDELLAADAIIIGVPMYNFSIHSSLKTWIDHVARSGKTFGYSANGPEGLVKNKKVYLAITTGGVYTEGPMQSFDFTEQYLRTVLGFLGMTDITTYRAEGLSMPGLQETALSKAMERVAV